MPSSNAAPRKGRHRLFDHKHTRKSYTRIGPTGDLYQVVYVQLWISPPPDIMTIPALVSDDRSPL